MEIVRAKGLRRVEMPDGMENDAIISDSGVEMPIPESKYRERGYKLSFDDLPWFEVETK